MAVEVDGGCGDGGGRLVGRGGGAEFELGVDDGVDGLPFLDAQEWAEIHRSVDAVGSGHTGYVRHYPCIREVGAYLAVEVPNA